MKLVVKTRNGAKVHKVYDTALTPYQRLLKSGVLTEEKRHELAAIYHGLKPYPASGGTQRQFGTSLDPSRSHYFPTEEGKYFGNTYL